MLLKLLLLVLLIGVNGVFSATEIAYLSLSKYELNKELKKKNKKAIKIREFIRDSSTFLSAIQIGITLSGFLASAFAADSFASELADLLEVTIVSKATLTTILIVIITIILSYFTLVFGELIPKKIGLTYSKQIAFFMVDIIQMVCVLFYPFIVVLRESVNFFMKILHIKEEPVSEEEDIKNTIVESKLEELEKDLLFRVFQFNDTTVKEIMTEKKDIIFIEKNATFDEILATLKKYKYTRYPIIEDDRVIGFLNIKDLMMKDKSQFSLKKYIRKLNHVQSSMIIDDAFLLLRSKHNAMVKVMENGEMIGIVTIEDIIEEIVGNIADEYN